MVTIINHLSFWIRNINLIYLWHELHNLNILYLFIKYLWHPTLFHKRRSTEQKCWKKTLRVRKWIKTGRTIKSSPVIKRRETKRVPTPPKEDILTGCPKNKSKIMTLITFWNTSLHVFHSTEYDFFTNTWIRTHSNLFCLVTSNCNVVLDLSTQKFDKVTIFFSNVKLWSLSMMVRYSLYVLSMAY